MPCAQAPRAQSMNMASAIAVVHPEVAKGYRATFNRIMDGIIYATRGGVRRYLVSGNDDGKALNAELKRDGIKVAITFGREGSNIASLLDRDISVVNSGGQTLAVSRTRPVIQMNPSPSPALLLARLKALQPRIKRIFVIYDPQQNNWLIELASAAAAAAAHGLELITHQAGNLASAVRLYQDILGTIDASSDALWLPYDTTTVDEDTVLPLVLKVSWERRVVVFSSNMLHVRKGVLFALYPNNLALGRSLATTALAVLAGEPHPNIVPLPEVESGINLRTAWHLGLKPAAPHQLFTSFFPESP